MNHIHKVSILNIGGLITYLDNSCVINLKLNYLARPAKVENRGISFFTIMFKCEGH